MRSFVDHLNPATDYHIGVVLEHAPSTLPGGQPYPTKAPDCIKKGPNSCKATYPNNKMGQLFVKNGQDQAVLDFSKFVDEAKSRGLSDSAAQATQKIASSRCSKPR